MRGDYSSRFLPVLNASIVDVGDGRAFLVLAYQDGLRPKTVVLERQQKPECWVSRRELDYQVDSIAAVTGLLLGPPSQDPVGDLKRSLMVERRANWDLRQEIAKLKEGKTAPAGRGRKERGVKRGRRNS